MEMAKTIALIQDGADFYDNDKRTLYWSSSIKVMDNDKTAATMARKELIDHMNSEGWKYTGNGGIGVNCLTFGK